MQFIKKHKNNIIFFLIGFLILASFALSFIWPDEVMYEEEKTEDNKVVTKKESKKTEYIVDIKGMVQNPGVYSATSNERVNDIIKKAGGLLVNADTSLINLSQKVKDEMVIIIYSKQEVINMTEEDECECPENNDACVQDEDKASITNSETESEKTNAKSSKISINKATKEELMTLSGIGEAKAEAIIKYREENGDFETKEEITKVSGIGDALYEKIKGNITT